MHLLQKIEQAVTAHRVDCTCFESVGWIAFSIFLVSHPSSSRNEGKTHFMSTKILFAMKHFFCFNTVDVSLIQNGTKEINQHAG